MISITLKDVVNYQIPDIYSYKIPLDKSYTVLYSYIHMIFTVSTKHLIIGKFNSFAEAYAVLLAGKKYYQLREIYIKARRPGKGVRV